MTADQAKTILIAGYVYGNPLTDSQRARFAKIAGTDLQGNDLDTDSSDQNQTDSSDASDSSSDSSDQQYRFGGDFRNKKKWPKNFTSKNIQSSLNVLMLRNRLVFGPEGKHNIYMPGLKKKYGGWLDQYPAGGVNNFNMNKKKQGGEPEAFPQQPTDDQFFSPTFIPHQPKGFYAFGGGNPPAFPQQPPFDIFMTNAPWHPVYNQGGQPCFKCGGMMPDGGTPAAPPVDQFSPYMNDQGKWVQNMKINGNLWYRNQADKDANRPATRPALMQNAKGDWVPYQPTAQTTTVPTQAYGGPSGAFMFDHQFKNGGNWIQDANKKMKAKGTKGAFTDYCGGHVTAACIERGLNSDDPTTRKRAAFAKAMRHIAKKQLGGDAPQGFDMDNIIDSKKDYFKNFISKNALNAWADEDALNLSDMHDHMMAAYGMQTVGNDGLNYQNIMNAQALQNKLDEGTTKSSQDFGNLYNAGLNMAAYANPYYQVSQKKLGGYFADGGSYYMNPYGAPAYGVAPNLIPFNYQPYYKFRTNMAPGPNSFLPPGTDLSNAKNFNYDYRGRFFGAGPRRVKMSWDELASNPNAGGTQQQPVNTGTVIPRTYSDYNSSGQMDPNEIERQAILADPMRSPTYMMPQIANSANPNPYNLRPADSPSFRKGGVYELSADQIKQIMDAGGEIEYVD